MVHAMLQVTLKHVSHYWMYYEAALQPWVHYVPVGQYDARDILPVRSSLSLMRVQISVSHVHTCSNAACAHGAHQPTIVGFTRYEACVTWGNCSHASCYRESGHAHMTRQGQLGCQ
jgi:hypothetical protein